MEEDGAIWEELVAKRREKRSEASVQKRTYFKRIAKLCQLTWDFAPTTFR